MRQPYTTFPFKSAALKVGKARLAKRVERFALTMGYSQLLPTHQRLAATTDQIPSTIPKGHAP
jgi:hypothetical protein